MTQDETIKVLELLNAFFAGGKNDPKQQVIAWHLVLGKYDFEDAMNAVIHFAENDRRDYATFPGVGKIVGEIRDQEARRKGCVRNIIHAVAYGRGYDTLSDYERQIISRNMYNDWLEMDAEEFSFKSRRFTELLTEKQERLRLEGGGQN